MLLPVNRGNEPAVQLAVPVAFPEYPADCHVTLLTPTLSDAVPVTVIVADVVLIVVPLGEVMVMVGGM
jgi:hypothetical protein